MGLGKEKNAELAEKYFLLSIKHGGDNEAIINLTEYYQTGIDDNVVDFEKAKKMYLEGVKENPYRAYDGLSKLFFSKKEYKESYEYALKGAQLNNPESQNNLGYYFENGIYVKKDIDKAKYWYQLAATQGYIKAINNLKSLNLKN